MKKPVIIPGRHARGGGGQISEEAAYRNSLSISINPRYRLTLPVSAVQVETSESHAGRPLPAFLSGKMQQCFVSMPGNTFARQKMRKEREKRWGGEKDFNIKAAESRFIKGS